LSIAREVEAFIPNCGGGGFLSLTREVEAFIPNCGGGGFLSIAREEEIFSHKHSSEKEVS